jgi:heat-inducible transcriptional repressor
MEQRLEQVLTYLIEDYIDSAEPVSSQSLVKDHKLEVSSATIRNWFALLEQEGLLVQPHTSAGRIPTEDAFRWYVHQMTRPKLSQKDASQLKEAIDAVNDAHDRIKTLAKTCVELTKIASLVGTSASDTYYTGLTELFSKPEFKDWSRVISMSSVLDTLDQKIQELRQKKFETPTVLLGTDCPFGNACGSIVLTLPDGAFFALLGPIRMDYKRAMNVMAHIQSLQEEVL